MPTMQLFNIVISIVKDPVSIFRVENYLGQLTTSNEKNGKAKFSAYMYPVDSTQLNNQTHQNEA